MKTLVQLIAAALILSLFLIGVMASDLPRVYIDAAQVEMNSGSAGKDSTVKLIDFGAAITGALTKKKVPIVVVTDIGKSQWTIKSSAGQKEDSTGKTVAKIIFLGPFAGSSTKFEGTFQVIDNESTAVIFAYNVKKNNFQSAAEAFAKHFKKFLKKRGKRR